VKYAADTRLDAWQQKSKTLTFQVKKTTDWKNKKKRIPIY